MLLRAPTLSYPGGLFMLQAFRGRSGKEVIARCATFIHSRRFPYGQCSFSSQLLPELSLVDDDDGGKSSPPYTAWQYHLYQLRAASFAC